MEREAIAADSERAIARMTGPDQGARAFKSQYPDTFGIENVITDGVHPELVDAIRGEIETLNRNRQAFKAMRPDLHPAVLDSNGNPIVVAHGTRNRAGFTKFRDSPSGIFTAFGPDTAVTYTGEFRRSLTEKLARFGKKGVEKRTLDDVVMDPDVQRELNVRIEPRGAYVNSWDVEGVLPDDSPWREELGVTADLDFWRMPLTDEQLDRFIQDFGLDRNALDLSPWYEVTPLDGVPLVGMPDRPEALDVGMALNTRGKALGVPNRAVRQAIGLDDVIPGDVYPLFVDMTNPLVVDFEGRNWNDPPPSYIRVAVGIPYATREDGTTQYRTEIMDFDPADFGGMSEARRVAQEWADALIARDYGADAPARQRLTEASGFAPEPTIDLLDKPRRSSTDEYAMFARQEGYDGVIFRNIIDGGDPGRPSNVTDVFVVFDSSQLKHALDNDGRYQRESEDILRSEALPEELRAEPSIVAAAQRWVDARREAQRLVTVPAWMDARDPTSTALQSAIDFARAPRTRTRAAMVGFERLFINAFAPIRDKEMARRGKLADGLDSAFKAAEIAVNDPGRNESLLYYGAAHLDPSLGFAPKRGTIGIRTMLDKLGRGQAVQDWMTWMAARRAQEIKVRGIEVPLTDAEIQRGLELGRDNKVFQEVADDWKRFNDANVDFLVETGRIGKNLADKLKADAAYIPFYRSDETINDTPELLDQEGMFGAIKRGILYRNPGIKKLVGGSTSKIDHIVFNMIRNSQAMVAAGMRNHAANKIFDLMVESGEATIQPAVRVNEDGSVTKRAMPTGAVRMWRDGKESYVVPTDREAQAMFAALGALDPVRLNAMMGALAKIGSFFRQSITLSPGFIIRNMQRDAISTGVLFGGRNLTWQNNMARGFTDSIRKGASRQAFTAASGMGDFRFGGGDIGFGRNDILIDLGLQKQTLGYRWRQLVGAMENIGTAAELSNRLAIYNSLVGSGVRPDEAAYQALTITNYSRRGADANLRMLLPMVPFLNARIQGLARLYEDFATTKKGSKERQQAVMRLATGGAVLALASSLLWGWNNRDDEAREEYMSEPLHRRLNYHVIPVGDRKFYIPKAFEIGTIFATVPELALNSVVAGDNSELGRATVQTLTNTFGLNPVPQGLLPALELVANYDSFTGRAVEGQRLQQLPRGERINPQTSALAVALGQSGLGRFTGLSPVQLEHLLQGYGGLAYSILAMGVDTVAGEAGFLPARPEGVFGSTPGIAQFSEATFGSQVRRREGDPGNRWVDEFYDTRSAVIQVYRAAKSAAEAGDIERARQLLGTADPGTTAAVHRLVNRAAARMTEINRAIRTVRADRDMTGEEKTKILTRLNEQRNQIATKVMRIVREQEQKQGTSFSRVARQ